MKDILKCILSEMPLGTIIFDEKMKVRYQNSIAEKFLKRYGIATELAAEAGKIFREQSSGNQNTVSKDISCMRAGENIPVNLSVRYLYSEEPYPRVSVYISTKPCNSQLNVEEVITRYHLTKKEAEILRQLTRGLKNSDIARELHMHAHTVRDHLRSIYTKCGVKNKLELVRNIIT